MEIDDPAWANLHGGYREPYDSRPALAALRRNPRDSDAWTELWENLHHQGDVGEASYATIPALVDACADGSAGDWNLFALAGVVEGARRSGRNPPVPPWLKAAYERAWIRLLDRALGELRTVEDPEAVRSLIAVVAWAKGLSELARLTDYSEDELAELQP